jgi:ATP-dependent protease ClpP protease subunit
VFFLGKTYVYSAGVTIMGAVPCARRFLTHDTQLLIHERKLRRELHLDGPLSTCASILRNALEEVEAGQRLERTGFEELVEGCNLDVEALLAKVLDQDWYLDADMAERLGLVRGLV